jgi:hypothetical protein
MSMKSDFTVRRNGRAALPLIEMHSAASPAAPAGADSPASNTAKSAPAADPTSDWARNHRVLSEFGSYRTEFDATSTLDTARPIRRAV